MIKHLFSAIVSGLIGYLSVFLLLSLITSCGAYVEPGPQGPRGISGNSCTAIQEPEGVRLTCTDGSVVIVHNGLPGLPGPKGIDGVDGRDGTDGVDGQNGADGVDGQNGTDGIDGTNGVDGQDGVSGTTITTVQFCTGIPLNQFPEVGYCINNQLYAVYSSGGLAWLTLIVPGTYSTTTDGVNCTFTVSANCEVN